MNSDTWYFLGVLLSAVIITAGPLYVQLKKMRKENNNQHNDVGIKLDNLVKSNEKAHNYLIEKIDGHVHDHLSGIFQERGKNEK